MDIEHQKSVIEMWKTAVDVQKHFNEIEMRIRGLFVSMVLALAAAQGFLMEKELAFEQGRIAILYATCIPLLGILGTYLFYFMDKHWYHRLLIGAVLHAIKIEKKYEAELPELGLSRSIGDASPPELKGWFVKLIAYIVVSPSSYGPNGELRSDGKIEIFYKPIALLFFILFVVTALFFGILVDERPLAFFLWSKF